MSEKMRPYVVRQGDYLTKLAFVHGFDVDEVWGDPKNDEIRGLRKEHHILAPGDVVYLPVKEKEGLPIQKGVTNRYVAKVPKVVVDLLLMQEGSEGDRTPIKNERYVVEGAGEGAEARTGDDGRVTLTVPVHLSEVSILLPERCQRYLVRVGHMDPSAEASGVRARLSHLGYLGHSATGEASSALPSDEELRQAIMAFQAAHQLPETGVADEAMRRALEDSHQG